MTLASIFLSHAHDDKEFVRRLNDRLIAHGILTWFDEAEIQVGDSLIDRVESAISELDYLGVVLSRGSVESEWVRREVNMALTEEIRGRRIVVLPLLVEPCELPGFLADKAYADFTRDFEDGLAKLLRRLGHGVVGRDEAAAARGLLGRMFREWIALERGDARLLARHDADVVIAHVPASWPSAPMLEFVVRSLARLAGGPSGDRGGAWLGAWLARAAAWLRGSDAARAALAALLADDSPDIGAGAARLLEDVDPTGQNSGHVIETGAPPPMVEARAPREPDGDDDGAARAALVALLLSLFTADQLRRFVTYGPAGKAIVREDMPGAVAPPAAQAHAAVDAWERRALIVDDLFDRLCNARESRAADIEKVRRLWLAPR